MVRVAGLAAHSLAASALATWAAGALTASFQGGETSALCAPLARCRSARSPDGRWRLTLPIAIVAATEENAQEAQIWACEQHLQAKVPAVLGKGSPLRDGKGILRQPLCGTKSAF